MTEAQKNRILKKIERFKAELRREKSKFGDYHDGRAVRYEIAHLYYQLGDHKKTCRYINWFNKIFDDDIKYGFFDLGAAVAKFETGKLKEAKELTININNQNTYIIDLLLDREIKSQDKHESNAGASLFWALEKIQNLKELLTPSYLNWLNDFRDSDLYQKYYKEYISIAKLKKNKGTNEDYFKLSNAHRACLKKWKSEA